MLRLIAFVIFFLASSLAFSKERHFNEISKLNLNVTKKDIYTSKLILEIYKDMKYSRIDSRKVLRTIKRIDQPSAIDNFKPSLDKILEIHKSSKSLAKIISTCSTKVNTPGSLGVFDRRVDELCNRKFWNLLLRNKNLKKLGHKTLTFINDNISSFLNGESSNQLVKLLQILPSSSTSYLHISEAIKNEYKNNSKKFNQNLLSNIHLDSNFTSYVQSNGFIRKSENGLFNKEFHALKRKIYNNLAKDNIKTSKQMIYQLMSFHRQNISYISRDKANLSFLTIAKNFYRKGHFDISNEINFYVFKNAGPDDSEEAAFGVLFNFIIQNKFALAVESINKMNLLKDFEKLNSKLQYWISYSVSKYGQKDMADVLYKKLIKTNPLSFYSIIALKENFDHANSKVTLLKDNTFISRNVASGAIDKNLITSLKRLRLWLISDNRRFVLSEMNQSFSEISNKKNNYDDSNRKILISKIAGLINDEKKYLYTFQLIHNAIENNHINLDDQFLKLLFPKPYLGKIKEHNREIDPYLILSLIRQESAFNPAAMSRVGARGLMQLMPATARQFKRKLKNYHLKRPDLNLKIGIKYFKKLLKKYDGNLIYTLASYNAGEGNLKKWTKTIFNSDDPLITIEMIPYRETRKYVKLIYRNLYFYKYLTNQEEFLKTALNDSFIIKS